MLLFNLEILRSRWILCRRCQFMCLAVTQCKCLHCNKMFCTDCITKCASADHVCCNSCKSLKAEIQQELELPKLECSSCNGFLCGDDSCDLECDVCERKFCLPCLDEKREELIATCGDCSKMCCVGECYRSEVTSCPSCGGEFCSDCIIHDYDITCYNCFS